MQLSKIGWWVVGLGGLLAVGCGPSGEGNGDTSQPPVSAAEPAVEASVSAEPLGRLHQFSSFEINLPPRFEAAELPELPPNTTMAIWKAMRDPRTPEAVVLASAFDDPNLVTVAKSDMLQALLDYSTGSANSMGVNMLGQGETENSTLAGHQFTHFVWVGQRDNGMDVGGTVYGAIVDERFVTLLYVAFGGDPDSALTEISDYLRSFRLK